MAHNPVDIAQKLSLFSEHWSPKTVARLNDYEIKVVKVQGGFTWLLIEPAGVLNTGDAGVEPRADSC